MALGKLFAEKLSLLCSQFQLAPQEKSVQGRRREGSNLIQVCRVGGQMKEQVCKGSGSVCVWGVWAHAYALTYTVKSKITPSHLSHILQGVLVGLVGQVGQEVQFFHNLVSQVGQVILEVLWVRQLNPLLVPISDEKYFFECISFTAAGPSSLVATFSEGLPPHHCLDKSLYVIFFKEAWILMENENFDHIVN